RGAPPTHPHEAPAGGHSYGRGPEDRALHAEVPLSTVPRAASRPALPAGCSRGWSSGNGGPPDAGEAALQGRRRVRGAEILECAPTTGRATPPPTHWCGREGRRW